MKRFLAFLMSMGMGASTSLAAAKVQSKIEVSTHKTAAGMMVDFKVVPDAEYVINEDGPWQLEIKKSEGLEFEKQKLVRSEIDFKLPGFHAAGKAKAGASKGEIEYRLIAFVCTKDKARCFRDVHSATASWTSP